MSRFESMLSGGEGNVRRNTLVNSFSKTLDVAERGWNSGLVGY